MQSENILINTPFSHIYIENDAFKYELTNIVLSRFNNAKKVAVRDYRDLFHRPGQSFASQKQSPKIILAVKDDSFIYSGSQMCHSFGHDYFYYSANVLNCIYDCQYCYLQGMYPSSNLVVFVNIEDCFMSLDRLLEQHPVFCAISYDTDLLALEGIIPLTEKWIRHAAKKNNLTIEIRTKSANFNSISHLSPLRNVILAWTLSPDYYISSYENNTPPLSSRLSSITNAISAGWPVRLCFDPLIWDQNFYRIYSEFINQLFSIIPPGKILDASIGTFRMPSKYLKKIRRERTDSPLIFYPFETKENQSYYPASREQEMVYFIKKQLLKHLPQNSIWLISKP